MVNWVRFGLTSVYGLIVFMFFFAYLAGFVNTSSVPNDILYVGGIIMLGIILSMVANVSESKS